MKCAHENNALNVQIQEHNTVMCSLMNEQECLMYITHGIAMCFIHDKAQHVSLLNSFKKFLCRPIHYYTKLWILVYFDQENLTQMFDMSISDIKTLIEH